MFPCRVAESVPFLDGYSTDLDEGLQYLDYAVGSEDRLQSNGKIAENVVVRKMLYTVAV